MLSQLTRSLHNIENETKELMGFLKPKVGPGALTPSSVSPSISLSLLFSESASPGGLPCSKECKNVCLFVSPLASGRY